MRLAFRPDPEGYGIVLGAPRLVRAWSQERLILTCQQSDVTLDLLALTLMEKPILGSIFGSATMRVDVPKLLKLYRDSQLGLDSMITTTTSSATSTWAIWTCETERTSAVCSSATTYRNGSTRSIRR